MAKVSFFIIYNGVCILRILYSAFLHHRYTDNNMNFTIKRRKKRKKKKKKKEERNKERHAKN